MSRDLAQVLPQQNLTDTKQEFLTNVGQGWTKQSIYHIFVINLTIFSYFYYCNHYPNHMHHLSEHFARINAYGIIKINK